MLTVKQLQTFSSKVQELIFQEFSFDSWRSTSFLIQLLGKQESYYQNLAEANPDTDFYSIGVAMSSALELINMSYNVPTDDERFENVEEMYNAVVNYFIKEVSDDALMDLVYLGGLSNFVANMRVNDINEWIEQKGPSEDKFEMLRLAKRDAKAVELATKAAADLLLPNAE